ncbi:thioredoxin reductase (NADPH) [Bacilli bacterium PM5-3]|nr:thioredoxin reductase (NADPH) [Bacilli bacterium PM5-3]MDH6603612.1 thioredoxin reductase (NADPH) [Bacilli bacterium PM5-9]
MENKEIRELIIIGAGPAGLTAAVYAKRANLDVMLLEASSPGGKLVKTAEIENWPGIKQTSGPDLALSMFDHAMSLGVVYQYGVVNNIVAGEIKEVQCADGNSYYAKAVLIATGTVERKLGIPGEEKFTNRGVSYCAVCDGALFKDKVVTVIGGGNSALEEALYLTKFASKVNVVIRRDVFRADKIVQDEVFSNDKINPITKHLPQEVLGDDKVKGIVLENVDTNERHVLDTDGLFPFIGLDPITDFVKDLNITDKAGYIITNENMETSIDGIYSAGDVNEKDLRQVVTAASDGAIAAQQIIKYLEQKHV